MKISRRNFIAVAPVAVTVVSQMNGIALGQPVHSADRLAKMTSAVFLPYVGTNFTFRGRDGNAVVLRLADVDIRTPASYVPAGRGEECFALRFEGPAGQPLAQDTYDVDHFAFRSFSLFITENGGVDGGRLYDAVINRIAH